PAVHTAALHDALPVFDPGHTGVTDPGAVAGGLREADVTLDVALKLRDLLAGVPGLEVRLTRDRHVDLATPYTQSADLRARTNMADRKSTRLHSSHVKI